jgi:2-desacetyl-2-hydroxyethyl bacteriochlorophyllide A dehydrogenase
MLEALAVDPEKPEHITLNRRALLAPEPEDVMMKTLWSGIGTATERQLWSGFIPSLSGTGYPQVPVYASVGIVARAGHTFHVDEAEVVVVRNARCFGEVLKAVKPQQTSAEFTAPEPVAAMAQLVAAPVGTGAPIVFQWNYMAEKEQKKIPFLVRGKVRCNTERYASECGVATITIETLYDAKAHFSL